MNIEYWSIDANRGKPMDGERSFFQNQKCHTGWLGTELEFLSAGYYYKIYFVPILKIILSIKF
jgi:hypothetical protein